MSILNWQINLIKVKWRHLRDSTSYSTGPGCAKMPPYLNMGVFLYWEHIIRIIEILKNLKVYPGSEHPHAPQQPVEMKVGK